MSGDYLDRDIAKELETQVFSSDRDKNYLPVLGLRARDIKEDLSAQMKREIPLGEGFESIVSMKRTTLENLFS